MSHPSLDLDTCIHTALLVPEKSPKNPKSRTLVGVPVEQATQAAAFLRSLCL